MAKLIWAVLCRRVLQDAPTNLMSYIDTVDALAASQFPVPAPGLVVGTLWSREGDEPSIEVQVRVLSPDGAQLGDVSGAVLPLEPQHQRGRVNVGLAGFPMNGPGRIEYVIEIRKGEEWIEAGRLPLDLSIAPPDLP